MSLRFPAELPALPTSASGAGSLSRLEHGELLTGKITRVSPEGMVRIRFGELEVEARGHDLFRAGQRVLAHVQKTRGETVLSLLPNATEGEVLEGTAVRTTGSEVLARFGNSELIVRGPGSEASTPTPGTHVRAQVQISGGKPTLQMLPAAGPGPTFSATVTVDRGNGIVLIDVGGTTLVAEAAGPTGVGELVQARLSQLGDKWILQLLQPGDSASGISAQTGPAGKIDQILARLIAKPQFARLLESMAAGELRMSAIGHELLPLLLQLSADGGEQAGWISSLARALDSILLDPQRTDLAQQLVGATENSGLFLESRFLQAALAGKMDTDLSADLKLGLLLAGQKLSQLPQNRGAAGATAAGATSGLGEIAGKVGQLLDAVTAAQAQNLRLIPSNELYIQLPFAPDSGVEGVEIRISPRGKRADNKVDPRNILLTLAVDTSNLGRVKAALSIADGQVSCRFRAENESVVALLTRNAGILKEGLEKLNYKVACFDCTTCKDRAELSVFDAAELQPPKGLDVRA